MLAAGRSTSSSLTNEQLRRRWHTYMLVRRAGTPAGPVLSIDGASTPLELLATIPEIIARHLEDAGVERAAIVVPRVQDKITFALPRAAALRLYPPVPAKPYGSYPHVPDQWLEEAAAWVTADLGQRGELWAIAEVESPIAQADALALLLRQRSTDCLLMGGEMGARVRAAYGGTSFAGFRHLALAVGGPGTSDEELLAGVEDLVEVARRLAPQVDYAFVGLAPSFQAVVPGGMAASFESIDSDVVEVMCDEIALDAFPYQILGPGHLRRLADAGRDLVRPGLSDGPRPLACERVEVRLGEPASWLGKFSWAPNGIPMIESPSRHEVQRAARELFAPLLPTRQEGYELQRARAARVAGQSG
jgi:hypothetical protein